MSTTPANNAQDVVTINRFSDAQLSDIASFDDALLLLADSYGAGAVESIADYGSGFSVTKDKDSLLGQPFVILGWAFRSGDYDDERGYVSAEVVTKDGRKLVINDGSTGIAAQLAQVTEAREKKGAKNTHAGLMVGGGLTKSEYYRQNGSGAIVGLNKLPAGAKKGDAEGAWAKASTYYLA